MNGPPGDHIVSHDIEGPEVILGKDWVGAGPTQMVLAGIADVPDLDAGDHRRTHGRLAESHGLENQVVAIENGTAGSSGETIGAAVDVQDPGIRGDPTGL